MGEGYEESTGKHKIALVQHKTKVLWASFIIGLCGGILLAERWYVQGVARETKGQITLQTGIQNSKGQITLQTGSQSSKRSSEILPASFQGAPELLRLLNQVAPSKEVLIGVSNKNPLYEGMLETFLSGVKQAGVTNYVIVALDKETEETLKARGYNTFYMDIQISKSQEETGANHAVSALKFGIIRKFLELGWAVLLSDIDVCVLQNPFNHLYRDHDVEGMTDGFDDHTAYGAIDGFDDPSMGWARYAQLTKHFNLNSGLFYLRPNPRTIELMTRLEDRLSRQKYWDQTAYNEEIFFLSHGSYRSPQVTVRVMEMDMFMNSKRLFKDVRNRPQDKRPPMPVMVHINYHPNKHERMKAVFKYYLDGDKGALAPFPGGSEPGTK